MSSPWLVVLAGGAGTRFWPRSRAQKPKQLLPLVGDHPLLVATIKRFQGWIAPEHVLVLTTEDLRDPTGIVVAGLGDINILVEPSARNTAPAIAYAMEWIRAKDPNATALVVPADHWIPDTSDYIATMKTAVTAAQEHNLLVTIGIIPTRPETGFGYIRSGDKINKSCFSVDRFVEKPSREVAETLVQQPEYYWNAGMFVWTLPTFFAELKKCSPDIELALSPYAEALRTGSDLKAALAKAYPHTTATSIDYALMEKSKNVAVVPGANFSWNDLGSFVALDEIYSRVEGGVARARQVFAHDSIANIVDCPDKIVALVGVTNMIIVDSGDVLLLAAKEHAQDVKKIVERLKSEKRGDLL